MPPYYPVAGSSKDALSGKTLIIPSVSLANLPQLAVDLLIASLHLSRIGFVGNGDTTVPFAGSDEHGIVTGGLEAYGDGKSDVVVIQQRSPTIKSKKDEHVTLLHDFILESRPREILFLTSLDAANQDDLQLSTPIQSILPPFPDSGPSSSSPLIESLRRLPALNLNLAEQVGQAKLNPGSGSAYPPFLPGAGLTRRLLGSLSTETTVSHGTIAAWCVEGDNRDDAYALVRAVLAVLGLDRVEIVEPPSWEGLFGVTQGWSGGAGADSEIYG